MGGERVRLVLSGRPGVGKTTVVERLAQLLRAQAVPVGGFVTTEMREAGHRIGFVCKDLADGYAVIAHVGWHSGPRVGRYGIDVEAFESIALRALSRAADERAVVIVDELGSMELISTAFVKRLQRLLEGPLSMVMTMHTKAHPVTDELRSSGDVEVVKVTLGNRQQLPELLHRRLVGAVPGPTG